MKSSRSPVLAALADPRLRCVSLAGRGMYIDLLRIADALKSPVIRFGDHIPNLEEISKAVGASLQEVTREIEGLVTFGLIQRTDDKAITLCALSRQFERTEINRANGLRGGRPRKTVITAGRQSRHG